MQQENTQKCAWSAPQSVAPSGYAATANGKSAVFKLMRRHGFISGSSLTPHQHVPTGRAGGVNAKPMECGVGAWNVVGTTLCFWGAGRITCWYGDAPRPYCVGAGVGAVVVCVVLVDAAPAFTAAVPSAAAPLPINLATPATPFATAFKSSDVDFEAVELFGTLGGGGAGGYKGCAWFTLGYVCIGGADDWYGFGADMSAG